MVENLLVLRLKKSFISIGSGVDAHANAYTSTKEFSYLTDICTLPVTEKEK